MRGASLRPPRFSSIASARAVASWRTRASSSPIVSSGTSVRRSAPSRRMPRSFSERSTAMPSASVALTSTISLSGSRAPTEGSASTPSSSICTPSIAPISSRASCASASARGEQILAALLHQRTRAIDGGEQAGRGARRLEDVERGVQAIEVEVAGVAREQQRAGRERGECLVRGDRHRIGAERERGGRHIGMEAEVAGPGLVADQRDPARVRELGDARDVRHDAEPGRLDEQDRARVRLGGQSGLDGLDRMAERDAAALVDRRWHPDRARAREHEAGGDRLVRAARDEHRLALGRRPPGRAPGWGASSHCPRSGRGRRRRPGQRAPRRAPGCACPRAGRRRRRASASRGEQRVVADQRRVALVARRRERRRRLAQKGIHRIGERGLGGLHVADAM